MTLRTIIALLFVAAFASGAQAANVPAPIGTALVISVADEPEENIAIEKSEGKLPSTSNAVTHDKRSGTAKETPPAKAFDSDADTQGPSYKTGDN